MDGKRVGPTIKVSDDIEWKSDIKDRLRQRENELRPIWLRKPYSGTIAEPKGSGSEVVDGLQ